MKRKPTTSIGSAEIASQIREEILSGRMPEGHRLTEAAITKRFGVGRGLVREAVQKLSHQGLLQTKPNCGAVVAPEAPKAVRGVILPLRKALEVYALREIFDELRPEDFAHWNEILKEMQQACVDQDFHTIAEMDIAFHRYLLERLDQPDLLAIWDLLVGRIRSHFRRSQRRCHNLMDIYEEHRTILETFQSGTLDQSVRLLKEKID
ncbi:GntR family transcriptional regulator [Planctomicrobium sp. SH527]|uniref:GntR family transcriptional regulator n=1 Tax=Planctomicrobium sp. SH527 TaxID=3448123 RepID=UPI003F5BD6E1